MTKISGPYDAYDKWKEWRLVL